MVTKEPDFSMKMTEERIIETVRGLPCLWHPENKFYKDLRVKENAWKEVAMKVSVSCL